MVKRKSLDSECDKENTVVCKMRKDDDTERHLIPRTQTLNDETNIIKNKQVAEVKFDENNNPIETISTTSKEQIKALRIQDMFEKQDRTEETESAKTTCTESKSEIEAHKESIDYTFSNSNTTIDSQEQFQPVLNEFRVNNDCTEKSESSSTSDQNSCEYTASTQSEIDMKQDAEEIINETIVEQNDDEFEEAVKERVEFIIFKIENNCEFSESYITNATANEHKLNETFVISVDSVEKPSIETQDSFIKFDANRSRENWLIELSGILKNGTRKIEHFVSAECVSLPTTIGLNVEGFGPISLPLIDSQAQQLIQRSEHDTRIVKNEFNSYEIEPSLIQITHPNWNEQFNSLIQKICSSMGCVGQSEAKLEKMILYTKDSHFVQSQSKIEEEKCKFATVVLQLPSVFEGGHMKLLEKEFDFGQSANRSPYFIHYAAHYADLQHEISKINAGFRLDLVYSLNWTNSFGYCPNVNQCVKSRLAEFLHKVKDADMKVALSLQGNNMSFAFPHNGFSGLKGMDAQRLGLLLEANERLPENERFAFYIAHVNMDVYSLGEFEKPNETSWDYLHQENEEHFREDDELKPYEKKKMPEVIKWYDKNGAVMFETLKKSVEFFDELIDPIADNTDFTNVKNWNLKFTQSRRVSKTPRLEKYKRTYGRYLLAFWPQTKNFDYLIDTDPLYGIEFLTSATLSSDDPLFTKYLDITLKGLVEHEEITTLSNSSLIKLLPLLITKHTNLEMCQKLIAKYFTELNDFSYDMIFGLIKKYGWLNLKEALRNAIVDTDSIQINCILVNNLFDSISPADALDCFNEFLRPYLDKLIETSKPLSVNTYLRLLKSVLRFTDLCTENIGKMNEHLLKISDFEFIKSLIREIRKLVPKTQLKQFKVLIAHYFNLISVQITKLSEFTWCMPNAELPGHREVENFLRSDQQSVLYTNVFSSIHDAREFANTYGGNKPTYSVQIVPEGRGRTSFVHIIKTNAYHAARSREIGDLKNEQFEFNQLLLELESN